jgi:ubiquinone/menaquinone biosynthesis C-methylase UbiE
MVKKVDYDHRQYAVYAEGRALSAMAVKTWMKAFANHCSARRPLTVLDLGSGTGRFTPAFADTFGGPVYGVEPSDGMRAAAERSASHPNVSYLAGSASQIPLPDNSCDAILMFLVLHHVEDQSSAATEIARVLRPGGRVLVRSTFSDRMPQLRWHDFFPHALEIEMELFPSVDEVVHTFSRVGLHQLALDVVPERLADSLADHAKQLRLRAISTFEFISEDDTQRGFAALDAAVADEAVPQPVETTSDLLVMGRLPTASW